MCIRDRRNIPPQLLIDCRELDCQNVLDHRGSNLRGSSGFLQSCVIRQCALLHVMQDAVRALEEHEFVDCLGCFCNWGVHRSRASAEIFRCLVAKDARIHSVADNTVS